MADPRDKQSRPTNPPDRGEDPPPGVYRALPAHSITGEPIARIAMRAPKVSELSPHQELMRALAATEGKMLAQLGDQNSAREAFEEKMRQELKQLVVREVRSLPPPPPTTPPSMMKHRFEWTHLQYVAAVIVALTGFIALVLNAQKPSAEVLKRFDAVDAAVAKSDKKIDLHIEEEAKLRAADRLEDYKYKLDTRSWITDVFERAASVKIDDPPGTPPREALRFYPPPLVDPHKVTSAHIVQPRDPYPVPPPP